jgi:anti-repressor protein
MTAPAVFTYDGGDALRTVLVDGEPWFVAADVARLLGYGSTKDMTRRLDDEDKGGHSLPTLGGEQEHTVITEAGLYESILGSRVDGARQFKRWVTHEVLPKIRRTGQFGSEIPTSFAEALELAAAKQREIETAEAKILADAPKVAAYDALMDSDGYFSMDAAAKTVGIGRNTLFRKLRDDGVLQRGSNLPYQRWAHHFIVTVSTWRDSDGVDHLAHTTRVRPSGLTFMAKRYASPTTAVAVSS